MKSSDQNKAVLVAALLCVFNLVYAQDSKEAVSEEQDTEAVRILHIETPIALKDIENSAPRDLHQQLVLAAPQARSFELRGVSPPSVAQQDFVQGLRDIESFEQVLEELEFEGGAWSVEIAEELVQLGDLLQAQGEYERSIELYDRAVHIDRVNFGLFSLGQVPLVQKVAQAHIALGQWPEADDRQQYAFYVQTRALRIDDPRLIDVFDNLARWNMTAFYRGIDEDPAPRLLQTYRLYRAAIVSVGQNLGRQDPRYVDFLEKLADAADMLNRYTAAGEPIGTRMNPELRMTTEFVGEPIRFQGRNNEGQKALERIVDVYIDSGPDDSEAIKIARAKALAALGDWYLTNGRRQAARDAYKQAYDRLIADAVRAELVQEVFGEIVFLPAFSSFEEQKKAALGLGPDTGARMGYIDISFDVNQYGRLSNFEVLKLYPEELARVDIQVLRSLRSTLVRPKIVEGEPVSSDMERYRFNFWY